MLYGLVEIYNARRKKAKKDGKYLHKMTLSKVENQSATQYNPNVSAMGRHRGRKREKYFE